MLSELRPLFEALDAAGDELTVDEQAVVGRYLRSAARALRSYVQSE